MAESPPKHRRSPALELPVRRTRSSTKPPLAVTPTQVRLRGVRGWLHALETRLCQPGELKPKPGREGARRSRPARSEAPGSQEPASPVTQSGLGEPSTATEG